MNSTPKPFEELNVLDNFLFNAVTSDVEVGEDFCRMLLTVLLQRKIGKLRIITERMLPAAAPGLRGIRMDVEVEEQAEDSDGESIMNIYDMEPHLQKETAVALARRNRFYQAKIDSGLLKSGERNFSSIPNLYALTITNYDPFGYDYMVYTVQNQCREIPELPYNDGIQFLYFYPDGKYGGNEEIRALLQYMQESTIENVTDAITEKVDYMIQKVKKRPEVKIVYSTYDDLIRYREEEAAIRTTINNIRSLLEDYGDIPDSLDKPLHNADIDTLNKWFKIAARASSIDDFIQKANISLED